MVLEGPVEVKSVIVGLLIRCLKDLCHKVKINPKSEKKDRDQ